MQVAAATNAGITGCALKAGSQQTPCWRGMDSNFQFRDISPPGAPSFGGEWRLLESPQQLYRVPEADDAPDNTARRRLIYPNSDEASKSAAHLARN